MFTQKDAVFNTVSSITEVDGPVSLTKDQKHEAIAQLATQLASSEIQVSEAKQAKMTEEKDYREYAANILNNWCRKDPRLNGGIKNYQPKNPGSRAGSGDEQIKEMKKLKSTLTDPEQLAVVESAINERLAVLRAERNQAKIQEINTDLLPESLTLPSQWLIPKELKDELSSFPHLDEYKFNLFKE